MKIILCAVLAVMLAGCASTASKNTDPFLFEYTPVARASIDNSDVALNEVVSLLEAEGFLVSPNAIFGTATTDPKDVGYQYWRTTNEKWKISYQIGVQVIETRKGMLYWKLSHKIIGSRTGKQDRLFEPSDFEVTESEINKLTRRLTRLLSASA
ncbi:hypothetical protein [Halomonas ramblicola]|uniref:hypothetical protein n=1 Tax=Halomonas ramblicola TaxID=747349 RepID=UPI0025B4898D|nr:hypothetical protein [Halomonas ramblicola]MDN3521150.1 hypothetical protein [Halomonas ramblicola]